MDAKTILIVGISLAAILVVAGIKIAGDAPGKYDGLAKCLSEKGVGMYGASWCPHCNNQKAMFGASWKYVDYVECATPEGETTCAAAGIKLFPTWVFGDGTRVEGEMSLAQLTGKTGCKLVG